MPESSGEGADAAVVPRPHPPIGDRPSVIETAALLRELTARLISSDGLDDALDRLADTLRQALGDIVATSVTMLRAGEPALVAASDEPTRDLDNLTTGIETPALTAIRTRDLVLSADIAVDPRWPDWSRRAMGSGVRGVLSAPVDIDDQVIGAISLYGDRPDALAGRQVTALLAAEHAGLLLGAVRDRDRRAQPAVLDGAPEPATTIGHAVGVVMAQRRCSAEAALQVLREASESLSIPLADVAYRLVASVSGPNGG